MAQARFIIRIPTENRVSFDLEEVRAWLRRRFDHGRSRRLFRISAIPVRSAREFSIVVEFNGGDRVLSIIIAELQEAVRDVIDGATLAVAETDFSAHQRPVLAEPTVAADSGTATDRHVNTLVAQPGAEEAVPQGQPLALETDYVVRLSISEYINGNLLPEDSSLWPDGLLSEDGTWLRAVLTYDGRRDAVVRPFFLPSAGPSYACNCLSGALHLAECTRRPWVELPLRTPGSPAVISAEVAIYYYAAVIHAQSLTLPAGEGIPGGPSARLLGRLTRSFSDLSRLAGRTVSILSADTASRIVVNSTGFTDGPFAIGPAKGDTSSRDVRQTLYSSHLVLRNGQLDSRFATDYSKEPAAFYEDFRLLAENGNRLYRALFFESIADPNNAETLPHLLRNEAEMRRRPPVIQVVDGQLGQHTILWSTVYDIPLADSGDPDICPSIYRFGPGGTEIDLPAVCPDGQEHLRQGNVLCPFGFWGLSCVIEQPPLVGRDLEEVVLSGDEGLALVIAPGESLDSRLSEQHFQRLVDRLPDCSVTMPSIKTREELGQALFPATMDVVYFYCHSVYDRRSQQGTPGSLLDFGQYQVGPGDITRWAWTSWPPSHWAERSPLVILNGCHTTEETSGTLNSFVSAFTRAAGASGVVGTEVLLEQGLAGWAMELMLSSLARGAAVGEAIREVRWAMLRKGNVMGFAYTPYCLANLKLRNQEAGV
jgi:hypothetical protein